MPRTSRTSRALWLSVLLATCGQARAATEWHVDYGKGLAALQLKQYAKAAVFLEKAVALRPEPSERARAFGQRYVEYYPYFYLGKTYQALGDEARARQRFETSKQLGELRSAQRLAKEREKALRRLRHVTPSPTLAPDEARRIRDALEEARGLMAQAKPAEVWVRLGKLRRTIPMVPDADEYRRQIEEAIQKAGTQQVRARRELEAGLEALRNGRRAEARHRLRRALELDASQTAARSALERAGQSREDRQELQHLNRILEEARTALDRDDLDAAEQKISEARELDPRHPALRFAVSQLRSAKATRRNTEGAGAELAEGPPDTIERARIAIDEREIRRARDRLDEAEEHDPSNPDITVLRAELAEAAKDKAARGFELQMSGQLDDAIRHYEDALVALDERPNAHLYLGLAHYTQYLVDGEQDPSMAEKAQVQIREALRLDPRIQIERRVTSPRVLSFLESVRREADKARTENLEGSSSEAAPEKRKTSP